MKDVLIVSDLMLTNVSDVIPDLTNSGMDVTKLVLMDSMVTYNPNIVNLVITTDVLLANSMLIIVLIVLSLISKMVEFVPILVLLENILTMKLGVKLVIQPVLTVSDLLILNVMNVLLEII